MAESIHELLDENEKAAEHLVTQVQAAHDLIYNINENFLGRMKDEIFHGSAKHALESMEAVTTELHKGKEEFDAHHGQMKEDFHHIQEKLNELDHRIDDVDEQLTSMWDTLKHSAESLVELTKQKAEEAEEHEENIFERMQHMHGFLDEQHEQSSLISNSLAEAIQGAFDHAAEQKAHHDSAIERLGEELQEHFDELHNAFTELVEKHEEMQEQKAAALEEAVAETLEEVKEKLGELVPASISSAAEGLVLGVFSEMMDSTKEAHNHLENQIEHVLDRIQEISHTVAEANPVLHIIENIR